MARKNSHSGERRLETLSGQAKQGKTREVDIYAEVQEFIASPASTQVQLMFSRRHEAERLRLRSEAGKSVAVAAILITLIGFASTPAMTSALSNEVSAAQVDNLALTSAWASGVLARNPALSSPPAPKSLDEQHSASVEARDASVALQDGIAAVRHRTTAIRVVFTTLGVIFVSTVVASVWLMRRARRLAGESAIANARLDAYKDAWAALPKPKRWRRMA